MAECFPINLLYYGDIADWSASYLLKSSPSLLFGGAYGILGV